MSKPVITLYFNDPAGKRWAAILDAARRAESELGAEIVIIKKTSAEYAGLQEKPPCPSVKVNDRFISRGDLVTFDQMKKAILGQESGGWSPLRKEDTGHDKDR